MESKQLTDYPPEEQAELKTIMEFMVRNSIINIKRWGGDMELSLHCRDGTYAVDMRGGEKYCFGHFDKDSQKCTDCEVKVECYESKIGGNTLTLQH
jgi:hypothetical protein